MVALPCHVCVHYLLQVLLQHLQACDSRHTLNNHTGLGRRCQSNTCPQGKHKLMRLVCGSMRAHLYHISQVIIRVAACERAHVLHEVQV